MALSLSEIQQAARRIAPLIHRTPVLTSESINRIAGCRIFFKCENFWKAGGFKFSSWQKKGTELPPGAVIH